eukprot:6206939-Pleurochrysis_carterae.AAC.3
MQKQMRSATSASRRRGSSVRVAGSVARLELHGGRDLRRRLGGVGDGAHDEPGTGGGGAIDDEGTKTTVEGSCASDKHVVSARARQSKMVVMPFWQRLRRIGERRPNASRGNG